MENLLRNEKISTDIKLSLQALKEDKAHRKVGDNYYRTQYAFSLGCAEEMGRLYPRGVSLLYMKTNQVPIRQYLAAGKLQDIDQCNSVFTLYNHLFKHYSIDCKNLQYYAKNREKVLKTCTHLTKQDVCSYMNNKHATIQDPFFKEIHDKIYNVLIPLLQKDYPEAWKKTLAERKEDDKENREGSFLSKVMQDHERRVTQSMMDFFQARGWKVRVISFDGLMLARRSDAIITDELLRQCEQHILDTTDIPMKIAEKDLSVPQSFIEEYGLPPLEDVEDEEIDEDAILSQPQLGELELAVKWATKVPTHVNYAKVLKITSKDTFVFDKDTLWMFDGKWRVAVPEDVRRHMDKHRSSLWNAEADEVVTEMTLLRRKKRLTEDDKERMEYSEGHLNQINVTERTLGNDSNIKSIINCFHTEVYDNTFADRMDKDVFLIGCNNGYVDIRTKQLHPFGRDVFITKTVGYNYFNDDNPRDQSIRDEWDEYIAKAFPKADERDIAHIYFGYCLRGDHPEKKFVIRKDKSGGDAGKSKLLQAITTVMGTYAKEGNNVHIYKNTGFSNQNSHNADILSYRGFRLAFFEELDDKKALDTKGAKEKHGGNSRKPARALYGKEDVMVDLLTKWVLIFNDQCAPKFNTSDAAFIARILVIPCRAKFLPDKEYAKSNHLYKQKADPHIDTKFQRWKPYILEWMMEGYQLYEEKGFTDIPVECKNWRSDVTANVHNLSDFVEDNIEFSYNRDDFVSFDSIKSRLPNVVLSTFKNKDNIVAHLSTTLRSYFKKQLEEEKESITEDDIDLPKIDP